MSKDVREGDLIFFVRPRIGGRGFGNLVVGEGRQGPGLRLWDRPAALYSAAPVAGRRLGGRSEENERIAGHQGQPSPGPVASAARLLGGSGFPAFSLGITSGRG